MRLVFLNQYYPPDAAPTGVMLEDLVGQLVRDGHEVSVLCAAGGYAGGGRDANIEHPTSNIEHRTEEEEPFRQEGHGQLGRVSDEQATGGPPVPHLGIGGNANHGQPPTLRLLRIGATAFGRGTFIGKLLDYATYYLGASWKLLTMNPPPDRIVALTTPPYLSVVARLISKLRGADHAHWVMDLYPEVLAAHGMLDARGLTYRVLAGLARWGFGGRRCAAVLTLGPDMAERVRGRVVGCPSSDKTQDCKTQDCKTQDTREDEQPFGQEGHGQLGRVSDEQATGGPPVPHLGIGRNANIEHTTSNIEHRTEEEESLRQEGYGQQTTSSRVHWVPLWGTGDGEELSVVGCPLSVIADESQGAARKRNRQQTTDNGQQTTLQAAMGLRRARGWGDDDLVVMYSGNMGLGHRFEEVLAAAAGDGRVVGYPSSVVCDCDGESGPGAQAQLTTDNSQRTTDPPTAPRLRLVFFGGGKRREEVAAFVREHPAAGIELYDYAAAADLAAHLQSADVHVASLDPAWTGTMVPSKVQGIFAAGRPVIFIGSAESSIGQWVIDSGGGWVVAAGDVAGLLGVLAEARDPVARATRGRAAKAFADVHFDRRTNVARVAGILTASR